MIHVSFEIKYYIVNTISVLILHVHVYMTTNCMASESLSSHFHPYMYLMV